MHIFKRNLTAFDANLRPQVCPGLYFGLVSLFRGLVDDDVLWLVLAIEGAGPPAVNLIVMCSLHGAHEELMARTMLLSYPVSFVTLLVWTTIFLRSGQS